VSMPPLAEWLRWMREMPGAFRGEPQGIGPPAGSVRVRAVVADLWETLTGSAAEESWLAAFEPTACDARERNRLRFVLAACHLLWQPFFKEGWLAARSEHSRQLGAFLVQTVSVLAGVASADSLAKDEERCEELVRRAIGAFGLRLPGESAAQAKDRLTQVDSVERRRLLSEVAKRQEKLRREAEIRRKAEEEAASKVSRE
jgi:hypothetical protein